MVALRKQSLQKSFEVAQLIAKQSLALTQSAQLIVMRLEQQLKLYAHYNPTAILALLSDLSEEELRELPFALQRDAGAQSNRETRRYLEESVPYINAALTRLTQCRAAILHYLNEDPEHE